MFSRRNFLWLAAARTFAADGLEWATGLGGKVEKDAAGNIVGISLRGTWVTDAELLDLARLPKLVRLDLSHTRITDEGMLFLRPASGIRDLNLFYAEQITDQGMAAIKDWKKLERLNVRGTRIFDGTLAIVSALPQLRALDIAGTQVTENALDNLVPLTHLQELSLGRSRLGSRALDVLRLLPTLEYLDLGGARSGSGGRLEKGAGALPDEVPRAIATLTELRTLKLGYSQIGAEGLRMLGALHKLQKLSLACCPRVGDEALAELAKWKSLRYLDVQETGVTAAAVEALRKARPDLTILAT
jgi:Leucine-rich repeat (LRR) protein